MTTSWPWCSGGTNGIGGAGMTLAMADSFSGAASAAAMNSATTSALAGSRSMPPTIPSRGCSRNWKRVATPKLPPPPRMAQNRSGWCWSSIWRIWPSAVTSSAASRLSMVRPCLRTRNPIPPPRVSPPIPTDPVSPNPVASPSAPTLGVGAGGEAGLGPGGAALAVDLQGGHGRQVEDDPAVAGAVAGQAVAAAADGQLQPAVAGQADHPGDLGRGGGPDHRRRPAVPLAVEDLAGLVVAGVVGAGDAAVEAVAELGDGDGRGGGGRQEGSLQRLSR